MHVINSRFYGQFIKFLPIIKKKSQIKSNIAQWSPLLTIKSCEVGLLVAEVHGAADGVDAAVMLGRLGADKGSVPRDQLLLSHALALVGRRAAADLADGDKTDAVGGAGRVGATAVAVTLEGCMRKRKGERGWLELVDGFSYDAADICSLIVDCLFFLSLLCKLYTQHSSSNFRHAYSSGAGKDENKWFRKNIN